MAGALVTDLFMTLDGFGTGPVGYWGKQGPELEAARERAFGDPDQTLLFGARTFRMMERFRETRAIPEEPLTSARKVVVSRTMDEPSWANTTLCRGDAVDVVPGLKAESAVPLRCHGSISMNRALLAAGLVDRLEVTVFPVITGSSGSNPVFAGLPDLDLELVETRTFDSRVQQLVYVPRGPWRP